MATTAGAIVATWGKSVHEPEGAPIKKIAVPVRVKLPRTETSRVVSVSCGGQFSALLTESGHVYTFGASKDGRLGYKVQEATQTFPKRIECLNNVSQLSCGAWHGLCLTSDHQVYIWGRTTVQYDGPTIVRSLSDLAHSDPVIKVGAGYAYSAALTRSGRLFLWGKNGQGKMGFGPDVTAVEEPRHLSDFVVRDFSLGYESTVFCTVDGRVFSMGSNDYYQLGIGKNKSARDRPHLVHYADFQSDPVIQVSTSVGSAHNCHSGAVTHSGALYMWGSGYKFKLGTNTLDDQPTPIRITFFDKLGLRVQKLVCGGIHNQALTTDHQIYSWGCGSDGRLGHPESDGHRYLYKEETPRRVQFSAPRKVLDLASSYYHVLAILDESQTTENHK